MNMIHYAASRTHNRNAFFQLLQELDANIALRDEYYRTPRDIAMSSNIRENVTTIDKFVVHIIARGMLLEIYYLLINYEHIVLCFKIQILNNIQLCLNLLCLHP